MAYVALFVALGGTSYAVATGSVDSRAIKNGSVRSSDLRDNEVRSRDIRNRTIVGRDLFGNTLGGDHIQETELGEVPLATRAKSADDALSLGGVPASEITSGGPEPIANTVDVPDGGAGTVLSLGGFGTLRVAPGGCNAGTNVVSFDWVNSASVTQDLWSSAPSYNPVPAGDTSPEFALGDNGRVRIAPLGSPAKQATIDVFFAGVDGDTECRVSALAVTSG